MNKFLVSIALTVMSLASVAQITITSSNMPSANLSLLYSNAKTSSVGNYTATGTNHVWDFSSLIFSSQNLREFKSGINTPYSIMFGVTAFGEKTTDTVNVPSIPVSGTPTVSITDIYNFYKKSNSEYTVEGLGVKLNGFSVPNYYTDKDELYKFPLTYGNAKDSSTFRFSTIKINAIPFVYVKQGHRITEVDGWGTITTPYGTESCLRIVTTQYSIDTLKGSITLPIVGPTPFKFGFPNVVRSYQWLTLGEKIPYLEITGNIIGSTFNPNQVRYRDSTRQFVNIREENAAIALSVFPNPSNNVLNIITQQNTEDITADIVDLQGKLVKSQLLKNNLFINQQSIDVVDLAKGLYVLNLYTKQNTQSVKFSIQ